MINSNVCWVVEKFLRSSSSWGKSFSLQFKKRKLYAVEYEEIHGWWEKMKRLFIIKVLKCSKVEYVMRVLLTTASICFHLKHNETTRSITKYNKLMSNLIYNFPHWDRVREWENKKLFYLFSLHIEWVNCMRIQLFFKDEI